MTEAANIAAIRIGAERGFYPTLIWDEREAVLIDAGLPGQAADIAEQAEKHGVPLSRLTRIIVTHQDLDHFGGLAELVDTCGAHVQVLSHAMTKPYVEGERLPLKMKPGATPPKAKVDGTVADGERLPYCGGITVIHTPGHTPDHICLYHHPSRTLIAADATVAEAGRLLGPSPAYTLDMDQAVRSLEKLLPYEIDSVICYHGGLCGPEAKAQLADLARREK
ncbi:MBL fold metallo-hydrolase [Paenibacillus sp.]|uniref:MBL fold metallo-hydrolase n=1 Tax=Paenibacillus sp. TaxID=58172 RepID=UPI002D2F3EEB|nr:MBL fold metallo-hydrolase [Paenibacillus sp.]HZG85844.1 MBL fold metallo-hydrolase [Paenibacillus sp.]